MDALTDTVSVRDANSPHLILLQPTSYRRRSRGKVEARKDGRLEWHLTSHFSEHEGGKKKKNRGMMEAQKAYDENQM
jgi:hypothetical protein